MKVYLIVGNKDTDFEGLTFAVCTSESNAEKAKTETSSTLDTEDISIIPMEADAIVVDGKTIYFNETINMSAENETKQLIDNLPYIKKDLAYKYLWAQHVREDVESHAVDVGVELTDKELDTIANRYAYEGDYDNCFTYWQNIENLIDDVIRSR